MKDSNRAKAIHYSRIVLPYGAVLRETYTVDRHLGHGQFADVYLVRHRYMGMQAMKVFRNHDHGDDQTIGFNEAFLLSKIAHPGIVRVFDANRLQSEYGSAVYITMEYVAGGTLSDLIRDEDMSVSQVLDLAIQMTDAVAHAHAQDPPIVHRDIKPQNVLVERSSERYRIRLADFGLAKGVNRITEAVAAGGSILYMSPESLLNYEKTTSDVYSLGLVIYQMLCGCLPYRLKDLPQNWNMKEMIAILNGWQREAFNSPSYFKSSIPPDIDAVVLRALAHSVEHRYPHAGALRDALRICQKCLVIDAEVQTRMATPTDESAAKAQKAIQLAFRVASTPGREKEANDWLKEALQLDPRLANRYSVYVNLWAETHSVSGR